jgi:PhnB protein
MQINPYLLFNGQCEEAFKFYERCLGGKIEALIPHEGTPAEKGVPTEWRKKILHARLVAKDGQVLMGSDAPPERYQKPQGFSVTIGFHDPKEGERVFNALAEKGQVHMPYQATFWAKGFGMLVDRYGTPWMINAGENG